MRRVGGQNSYNKYSLGAFQPFKARLTRSKHEIQGLGVSSYGIHGLGFPYIL